MTTRDLAESKVVDIKDALDLDRTLVYHRYGNGNTALHWSLINGRPELAIMLSQEFSEMLDMADSKGDTPLHVLGQTLSFDETGELAFKLAQHLLGYGASLVRKNHRKETPLLALSSRAGIQEGWLSLLKLLLSSGSNPNAQDKEGNTYLHRLAKDSGVWDSSPIVEILVGSGALSGVKNLDGETPTDIARNANNCHCHYSKLTEKFLEALMPDS